MARIRNEHLTLPTSHLASGEIVTITALGSAETALQRPATPNNIPVLELL